MAHLGVTYNTDLTYGYTSYNQDVMEYILSGSGLCNKWPHGRLSIVMIHMPIHSNQRYLFKLMIVPILYQVAI